MKNIKRTMFVIVDDEVIIAPQHLKCSHGEWFKKEGWTAPRFIEENPRGYVDTEGVYLYQGKRAVVPKIGKERIRRYIFELFSKLRLKTDLHIFLGTIHNGKVNGNGKLQPKIDSGSIKKLFRKPKERLR